MHPHRGCVSAGPNKSSRTLYRGTSRIRKRTPLEPYRRPMPRVIGGSYGSWAVSYGRGTPVHGVYEGRQGGNYVPFPETGALMSNACCTGVPRA